MKTLKISIIATIITSIIMLSCAVAMSAQAESNEFYPHLTIVVNKTAIDDNLWIISCRDKDGHVWEFFDDTNKWNRGDICNLLMWDTGKQEDNEIIDTYWEGYTNNINQFFQMNGWQ